MATRNNRAAWMAPGRRDIERIENDGIGNDLVQRAEALADVANDRSVGFDADRSKALAPLPAEPSPPVEPIPVPLPKLTRIVPELKRVAV